MNNRYFIRPIQQADGTQMVAILYNGEYTESEPAAIKLTGNNEVLTGEITMQNTGAFLGPVANSVPYQVEINENGETYEAVFTLSVDGKTMDFHPGSECVAADLDVIAPNAQAAVAPTYTVYKAGEIYSRNKDNLFEAINLARKAGKGATVVKNSDGSTVFKYGDENLYYLFQFTVSHGSATTPDAAENWVQKYAYSYAVESKSARFLAANYKLLRGEAPVWALEPDSGGYYYQYSQIGYKKASMVVDLKNAKLHMADSGYENFIAYAFINVHNGTHFYDLGIVFINGKGYWALSSNKYKYDPATIKYSTEDSVCTAHETNTEWVGDATVEITVEAVEDGFKATIKNLGTGRSYTIKVGNTPLNLSSNDFVFQFSASLVPRQHLPNRQLIFFTIGPILNNLLSYANFHDRSMQFAS